MAKYEWLCAEIDSDHNCRKSALRFDKELTSASDIAEKMWEIEVSRDALKQVAWFSLLGYKVRVK